MRTSNRSGFNLREVEALGKLLIAVLTMKSIMRHGSDSSQILALPEAGANPVS
jgi:hypothetical protein